MIEFLDGEPDVRVDTAEYIRLLGFPRGYALEGRALELAEWARDWYGRHGRPWIYARRSDTLAIGGGTLQVDGVALNSSHVGRILERAGADVVMIAAVSAGPEIEERAQQAWAEEHPDEYFFLETFGSAVVEHLTTMAGAQLCEWAEPEGLAVLPHYSPGYPQWDVSDQASLLSLLRREALPGALEVLESGMLRPKKSLLALFGLTRHVDRVRSLRELVACEGCSYGPCQFRRAPYRRGVVEYGVNAKALRRWAAERLVLRRGEDGTIDAVFRYDGTTCSNMGRPLAFDYRVVLGPRDQGYPIREQACAPAPDDDGHRAMCQYIREGAPLLATIAGEQPLLGRPLDHVLTWKRPSSGAGCYCEAAYREHKWGLVLETIHYALSHDAVNTEP
jgi:hypothetical protein